MSDNQVLTPILPVNDMAVSKAFYMKLGFTLYHETPDYIIFGHPSGAALHIQPAVEGGLIPGKNPFGLYFYVENVDEIAASVGATPVEQPWGMYEASFSDPDETLIRVGWPTSKRKV